MTEISNPRRVLAVSLAESADQLSQFIKDLTGTAPSPTEETSPSLAGTTHQLALTTPYYRASVPIWLDIVESPTAWAASFLAPEAAEVLGVLGGLVVVFAIPALSASSSAPAPAPTPAPAAPPAAAAVAVGVAEAAAAEPAPPAAGVARERTRELVAEVGRVLREGLGGWEWEGVGLGVGVGDVEDADELDEWDDLCTEWGLEFVRVRTGAAEAARGHAVGSDGAEAEKNEFGEKLGMPRVLEALEANEWAMGAMPRADRVVHENARDSDSADFGDFVHGAGTAPNDSHTDAEVDLELDPESLDFGYDGQDFETLRTAILKAARDEENDDIEALIDRLALGQNGGAGVLAKDKSDDTASSQPRPTKNEGEEAGYVAEDDEGDLLTEEHVLMNDRIVHKLQRAREMAAGAPDDLSRLRLALATVRQVTDEMFPRR